MRERYIEREKHREREDREILREKVGEREWIGVTVSRNEVERCKKPNCINVIIQISLKKLATHFNQFLIIVLFF